MVDKFVGTGSSRGAPHPLHGFAKITRAWFEGAFEGPTAAQAGAWQAIRDGQDALVVAPTGSGKTLAAFLSALDRLATAPPVQDPRRRLRVLYVSPLKALAADIERNLRAPLAGLRSAAARLDLPMPEIGVGMRTGDTPAADRRRFAGHPPDILITTPESLFLLLTSQARGALAGIDTVIVDEVHSMLATKRGAHLALSLERLDQLLPQPAQRIGLSATVRPVEEAARFLGGARPVTVVAPPAEKRFELTVSVPVDDMTALGEDTGDIRSGPATGGPVRTSIWPHIDNQLLDLVRAHASTIVFVNSRRLAERLCSHLNELAGEELVRAHHGSVSREQRTLIEEDLKAGRLRAVVATSSLELGIDMGAVDLVVQVEAPGSVATGLQRIGRAGHQVGAVSRGVVLPKFRGDLVECAVVVERMRDGQIEAMRYPRNPLDVLAQQVVAMVAMDDLTVDEVEDLARRSAPFAELPRAALEGVLDMLAGRYPSDEFAELRPRLNWDRSTGRLSGRPGAQRLAVTSGGTIPDRGLFGVFIAGERSTRVGELDEEMVYESRVGETFTLGASTWRIEDITHDRVLVSPAPGQPGKLPFWHGDTLGRPVELGRALGAFLRELGRLGPEERLARLRRAGLDTNAAGNLVQYLDEQVAATGKLPDDRTIVVERFRDELGDWRVCVHSPFGAQVHAPWAQAIEARVRERLGLEAQTMYTDDGVVVRLPEADEAPPASSVLFDPEDVEDLVVGRVGGSALFGSRFRECAARALLLPRRRPGQRTPLWQQRQRSAGLLQVAGRYGSFPIVLEAMRECLQDVFDLPALIELMAQIARREIRVVEVDTPLPSPFASSLQFGYVAAFMYDGDAPLAERRAQALSLDRSALAELLGREELRDLIDPEALATLELEVQRLSGDRRARDLDDLHDLLRDLGDLTVDEASARAATPAAVPDWLVELAATRRALRLRVAGQERWVAIEDAARYRDGLGTPLPVGVPASFLEPVGDPLGDLVARFARTHGPFLAGDVAARLGIGVAVAEQTLTRLAGTERVVAGEFRPGGSGREWLDAEVLRRLRRRSLAAFRSEVEPVEPAALARFLAAWQGVVPLTDGDDGVAPRGTRRDLAGPVAGPVGRIADYGVGRHGAGRGGANGAGAPHARGAAGRPARRQPTLDDVYRVVEQLQGAAVPASALERLVLPARLPGYTPDLLDQLCASGEVVWAGAGPIGSDDGWVALYLADQAQVLLPDPLELERSELAERLLEVLRSRGALFFRQMVDALGTATVTDTDALLALWELVWAGLVTNDTMAPLRALVSGGAGRSTGRPARRRRGPAFPSRLGPPAGQGRWSLTPERTGDATRRLHAATERMLDRYGIVTRGSVVAERLPGGFAGAYAVLKAMEERGSCRRGYFVDGLGGAQFAIPGAVDRLRTFAWSARAPRDAGDGAAHVARPGHGAGHEAYAGNDASYDAADVAHAGDGDAGDGDAGDGDAGEDDFAYSYDDGAYGAAAYGSGTYGSGTYGSHAGGDTRGAGGSAGTRRAPVALVLAATDPANPYGAALDWPAPGHGDEVRHRAGRKAGATVVLVDGELALYLEKGGRSLLTYGSPADDEARAAARDAAIAALGAAARQGLLGRLVLEKVDGGDVLDTPLAAALSAAGFRASSRGLRL